MSKLTILKKNKKTNSHGTKKIPGTHKYRWKNLFRKNPPTGLWGGLWCLPALDLEECPIRFIQEHYALEGQEVNSLTQLKHRFSHFLLHIHALKIETRLLGTVLREPQGSWFTVDELGNLGIATPTKKILKLATI